MDENLKRLKDLASGCAGSDGTLTLNESLATWLESQRDPPPMSFDKGFCEITCRDLCKFVEVAEALEEDEDPAPSKSKPKKPRPPKVETPPPAADSDNPPPTPGLPGESGLGPAQQAGPPIDPIVPVPAAGAGPIDGSYPPSS